MRIKMIMILFMGVFLFALALTPLSKSLSAEELEKCHKDTSCSSSCNPAQDNHYTQCKEDHSQASKNSSGTGIPNGSPCGTKWGGTTSDCPTQQSGGCGGYIWEAGPCDSS